MLIKDLPNPIKQMALDNMEVPDEKTHFEKLDWNKTNEGYFFWNSIHNFPLGIKHIINQFPNDQQLGEVVRKLANIKN